MMERGMRRDKGERALESALGLALSQSLYVPL